MITLLTELMLAFTAIVLGALSIFMFWSRRQFKRQDAEFFRREMQREINKKRRSF
jgi:hypothetical protein